MAKKKKEGYSLKTKIIIGIITGIFFLTLLIAYPLGATGLFLTLFLIVGAIIAFMLYFLPTYFAIKNKKTNALVIFLINLIFGWSIIGWLIALNMAMKHHHGMKT